MAAVIAIGTRSTVEKKKVESCLLNEELRLTGWEGRLRRDGDFPLRDEDVLSDDG